MVNEDTRGGGCRQLPNKLANEAEGSGDEAWTATHFVAPIPGTERMRQVAWAKLGK